MKSRNIKRRKTEENMITSDELMCKSEREMGKE